MEFTPALHAEWLKVRTLRGLLAALGAILVVTVAFSAPAAADTGEDDDPLFTAFFGVTLGQIAAVAFAVTAMAAEFRDGALRVSLAAVPRRGTWFVAKITSIALPVLAVGLVTGLTTLAVALWGPGARTVGTEPGVRAAVACGLHLTLMALLAAGLTAVLRSGVAALGILAPFLLIVSFVVGDAAGGVADLLPDRAGQVGLHSGADGVLGPWSGLAVAGVWATAAVAAGAWRVGRRDA